MTTNTEHTLQKKSFSSAKEIYSAEGRTIFLKLVEQVHGVNVSRLLGDLDFDSAHCLIQVDILSAIISDTKFLSVESRNYAFEGNTNKIRPMVQITLERFVQQMKEIDMHVCKKRRHRPINNVNFSSSSSTCAESSKRMKTSFVRKTGHRLGSSRHDDSFSSGNYKNCWSTALRDGNNEEQLEHHLITAKRIDHFLTKYCSIGIDDLTKTKVTLLYEFKVHEEQLYAMFMYLRNKFSDGIKENIDQANLSSSLSKMLRGFKPVGYHRM